MISTILCICTVNFNRGTEQHIDWYKECEKLDMCMKAVEKELDRLIGASSDDVDFKLLCNSEVLQEYEFILVAKSIRLLIKHKGKQWYLSESAGEIGEISFRAEAEAEA